MISLITPVLLTWNEEANLGRTLDRLQWAREIVVVDSGSTDGTHAICRRYANVRLVERPFDSHSVQWNFAVHATGITTEWVMALDADYVLTPALEAEIANLQPVEAVTGYRMKFLYCIEGQPLHGTIYPPVVALYRKATARYEQDGHTQRLVINGDIATLQQPALHDDRKPLSRWLQSQVRYAELECEWLVSRSWGQLKWPDRLRLMLVITPWLVPLYCFTIGQGFRDGRHGLYYALQRGIAETVLSLLLIKARLSPPVSQKGQQS